VVAENEMQLVGLSQTTRLTGGFDSLQKHWNNARVKQTLLFVLLLFF
jgi:hypothetical protein